MLTRKDLKISTLAEEDEVVPAGVSGAGVCARREGPGFVESRE